jgi:hypothetical protein
MKKGISISLSLLMLAAILHLSVATHYCGGKEVAAKISLTGKLADCGMERTAEKTHQGGTCFTRHCCDNSLVSCNIDSYYTPAFSAIPDFFQYNFQLLAIPTDICVNSHADLIPFYTNVSPPWIMKSTDVDLSDICVFRI